MLIHDLYNILRQNHNRSNSSSKSSLTTSSWVTPRSGVISFHATPIRPIDGGEYLLYAGTGDDLANGFNVKLNVDNKITVRVKGANYNSDVPIAWNTGIKYRFTVLWSGQSLSVYQGTTRVIGNAASLTPNPAGMVFTSFPSKIIIGAMTDTGVLAAPASIDSGTISDPSITTVKHDRWKFTTSAPVLLNAPIGAFVRITASSTNGGWDVPAADAIIVDKDASSITVQGQNPDLAAPFKEWATIEELLTNNPNNAVVRTDPTLNYGFGATAQYDDAVVAAKRTRVYQGVPYNSYVAGDQINVEGLTTINRIAFEWTPNADLATTRFLLDTRKPDLKGGVFISTQGTTATAAPLRAVICGPTGTTTTIASANYTFAQGKKHFIEIFTTSTTATLFINSVQVATGTITNGFGPHHAICRIGASNIDGNIYTTGGSITNVFINNN